MGRARTRDAGASHPPGDQFRFSCACGSVRFEIDGQPFRMHHCHCGRCRRARGAAHATNVIYQLEALRYTAGEELLSDFDLPGAQFFGTSFCQPAVAPCRGVPQRAAWWWCR